MVFIFPESLSVNRTANWFGYIKKKSYGVSELQHVKGIRAQGTIIKTTKRNNSQNNDNNLCQNFRQYEKDQWEHWPKFSN